MFCKEEIGRIAMEQSARDLNCVPEDFLKSGPVLAPGGLNAGAKKYYKPPIPCNFVSYGSNVVASVLPEYRDIAAEYIHKFQFYRCFETPAIHWLDERLEPFGQKVCFMAEYQLPDPDRVRPLPCAYALRVLEQKDFAGLYLPEWSNALCNDRKELDVLPYTTVCYSASTLCLAVYALAAGQCFTGYSLQTWGCFLGLALFATVGGQCVFNLLLKYLPATAVTMGILGEPVGTIILAFLIFGEGIVLQQGLGMFCILGGLWIYFSRKP